MKENGQLKELLLEEVKSLRQQLASLKASELEHSRTVEALRRSEAKYRLLFKSIPLAAWVYDVETLRFLAVNHAAVERYGYSRNEFLAMTICDLRPPEEIPKLLRFLQASHHEPKLSGQWIHRLKDGSQICVAFTSHSIELQGRRARLVINEDITERKRAEEEKEKLILELQEALANIKALRGLLPICAYCKKIRDDQGYWNQVDLYLREHSEVEFTHGVCPDCINKIVPGARLEG
jgi:hypothetical protein